MTLTLKPCGRGHWHTFTLKLEGPLDMFTFRMKAGDVFEFSSRKFWIVEVRP